MNIISVQTRGSYGLPHHLGPGNLLLIVRRLGLFLGPARIHASQQLPISRSLVRL